MVFDESEWDPLGRVEGHLRCADTKKLVTDQRLVQLSILVHPGVHAGDWAQCALHVIRIGYSGLYKTEQLASLGTTKVSPSASVVS